MVAVIRSINVKMPEICHRQDRCAEVVVCEMQQVDICQNTILDTGFLAGKYEIIANVNVLGFKSDGGGGQFNPE